MNSVSTDEASSLSSSSSLVGPSSPVKKSKFSHDWTQLSSSSDEDVDNINESDSDDDEDWIAAEYDKRRIKGSSLTTNRSSSSNFKPTSAKPTQDHRARSRPTGLPLRTSQSYPSRPNRYGTALHTKSTIVSGVRSKSNDHSSRARQSSPSEQTIPCILTKPRQCFGPSCTRPAATPHTKYCSEACGLHLAIRRLTVLLPCSMASHHGLQMQVTESLDDLPSVGPPAYIANHLDKLRLKQLEKEKHAVQSRLVELEANHKKLDQLIEQSRLARSFSYSTTQMSEFVHDSEQAEQIEPVVCVTCASEVSMRHALRHMEKCFQKMEGNTVFCANQKEQLVGTPLFCDTYDHQARAYCKRLLVVCEHYKEPKLPADTVCGFPIVQAVFTDTGQFCLVPRNKCSRHLGWERLRKAQIDVERYRCFIRLDDLVQEEQRLTRSISQRGCLLGLLLHRRIDHQHSKPLPLPPDVKRQLAMSQDD